ncbi:small acid-soluble spore protein Tlp [Paenibacillus sediminis]|uniref:Small acid-soluble spore protein (Thioredoxin-like protein) n=1 Tax=Paenibacillus sediminis TaxID=664909 RepID=A0ABS4H589_9BACL|nr:small acid-soluble spore protein Tlp [Paenibacillus sediminis]MBP1937703.1 small acid-soluble spore protein (thioredoxin-like protein) [Paenibacillus sediminis]
MAKPDNREDNVEKLVHSVQNTLQNFHEAQDYLNEFGDEISSEEREAIEDKNARRLNSVDAFRSEIKDEAQAKKD